MLIVTSIMNARVGYEIIDDLRQSTRHQQNRNPDQSTSGNLYDQYGNVYNNYGLSTDSDSDF